MTRNLKVLGLALVAMFAMSVVVASAASAAVFKNPEGKSAKIEASQIGTHVFSVEGSNVECENATFTSEGEVASGTTVVRVTPVYTGCKAFGFLNATITTTGCHYDIHMTTETSSVTFDGHIAVVCTGANKITIVAGTCEATVGSQEGLTEVMSKNRPAETPDDIVLEANVTGIKTNKVKDGFLCPLSGTGETTGTYVGDTKVIGKNGGTQVDITVD